MDPHRIAHTLAALLTAFVWAIPVGAQQRDEPSGPLEQDVAQRDGNVEEAPEIELQATVAAVKGTVQYRETEEDEWKPVEVGLVLNTGADLRTGVRSAVTFTIPPDHTITLDRLGTVRVLEAIRQGGKIKTNLGMKYGRTRVQLETGGREHETTVSTPGATLAVRGSDVTYQHDALVSYAAGQGRLEFLDRLRRQRTSFGESGVTSTVWPGRPNTGSVARAIATVDPTGAHPGRSIIETLRVEELPEVGGEDYRDRRQFFSPVFPTISPHINGRPEFDTFLVDMFFTGGEDGFTNVAMSFTDPAGFTLSGASLATPDGRGVHSGNAVQTGGIGQETVRYGGFVDGKALSFLPGIYTVNVNLLSAESPTQPISVLLNAFQAFGNEPTRAIKFDTPPPTVLDTDPNSAAPQNFITTLRVPQ